MDAANATKIRAARLAHIRTLNMNADQYHLGKIAEEAVEVAQRALKAQQFGLGEVQPNQDFDNFERLFDEFHDLFTTFQNFADIIGRDPIPDETKKGHSVAQDGQVLAAINQPESS
jgi:hypothetical protein